MNVRGVTDAVTMPDAAIQLGVIAAHATLDMKEMDFIAMVTLKMQISTYHFHNCFISKI